MSSSGPVTFWIRQFKAGNPAAAQRLWERYFLQLVALVRKKLRAAPERPADEDDEVLSAFDNFCLGAAAGRFPRLDDDNDLWQFLVLVSARKAYDRVNGDGWPKNGNGSFTPVVNYANGADSPRQDGVAQIVGSTPSPVLAAQVSEEYQRLLDLLDDPEWRNVAVWKLEGHTTEEIARMLGCVPRTVERKLRVIRSLWNGEGRA